jgi:flagellar protein FlaF
VRDNVLALSILIDRHVMARLGDLDGGKIGPILDINRAIAEGLSAKQVTTAAMPAQTQSQPQPQPPAPGGTRASVMRVSA